MGWVHTHWAMKNLTVLHLKIISRQISSDDPTFLILSTCPPCHTQKPLHEAQAKARKKAAPQPAQIEVADIETTTSSLVDVDSPHINTVPSTYESQSVKTNTQAERLQREERENPREGKNKEKGKTAVGREKEKAKGAYAKLCENRTNPVLVTNAILFTAASAGLGYGAYQKYLKGVLTWDTVMWWGGGIGAAGLLDYYVSRWFVQNKYPPK
ncbi:hypothetical protein CPC735_066080 [Coccidioides posadasii C735 delta SOWgp]|uniref:Uncharacterized protein n=1 Tax=Coccidioides posadasii (strain C735) TaxID=222929 RepID=C5PC31_COCP7|nr:hypothetical protein CPC735_066080 [Coccidioides posadasii C735 delta SOWgp]EER25508.1 hypothetical protein CPC735_066080 [Coccidioides posadasii C735 delta SOWgp]|eukprot:XP_003067653.1 hypothetical protein CPC735_066080 [Coccidioides posadasii C735 delta SOWgp]